ncbi:MAG: response regulator transcription factor [Calditrichia bacterium]|jgi:DNA-binding response OmpR family regulator|nr:response regulator transcription factor [Calditrichia bacterium]
MKRILIIEDDPAIVKGLQESLEDEHYNVITATDGKEGYEMAGRENPDLILLDLMLPTMNGQDICRKLREDGITVPILMLTSKREETDKVLGLELGADDYITKPCSLRELHARIKANLRRSEIIRKEVSTFTFADLEIDFKKQKSLKKGKPIQFSAKEYEILHFFIQHDDEIVSRDMLLDEVWGYDVFPTTRTVDNYILNLRKKIEKDPALPKHILTIHKSGYRFISKPDS